MSSTHPGNLRSPSEHQNQCYQITTTGHPFHQALHVNDKPVTEHQLIMI